ncbi:46 kDa FK506-binding nuclear protein-like [Montipora capricornis]|uniref:46 kDa FK506-binding nuclear protein-like n=1 Tax=Montipora capricornis TaxID=246305 RepID=UPI0035F11BC9
MFWGVTLDSGKRYTQTVEKSFHLSMAALGFQNCSTLPVTVMVEVDKAQFALCTLQPGKIPQQSLDYCFTEGEEITFFMEGPGDVHLTGYLMEEPNALEFEEDEEEMTADSDESSESVPDANSSDSEDESLSDEITFGNLLHSEEIASDSDEEDSDDDDWDPSKDNPKPRKRFKKDKKKKNTEKEQKNGDPAQKKGKLTERKAQNVNSVGKTDSVGDRISSNDDDDDESWTPEEKVETENKVKVKKKNKKKKQTETVESAQTQTQVKKVKKKDHEKNETENEGIGSINDVSSATNTNNLDSSDKSKKKKRSKHQNKDSGLQASPVAKMDESGASETNKRKLPGGIVMEDLKKGNGPVAKKGQLVHVYYKGNLAKSKKQFDACLSGPPFSFRLGAGEVISGWDLGVAGMQVGGKRKLTVPPSKGYGSQKRGPIPPNSTLEFEIQLMQIQ